jgi:hypothetical membrane protein
MRDQTVLFVDFNELIEQVGRTFRSIPSEVEPIVANLSLANMDFAEFGDNANPDGILSRILTRPSTRICREKEYRAGNVCCRADDDGRLAGGAVRCHQLRLLIVRSVPWWGVVSSAAAPLLMVAGWSVAAWLQPRSFDPVAEPVSALAAVGAADRWVMSLTFVVVGACVFVTGLALRPARAPGRLILMAGAIAGMLVAANPEHAGTSFPVPHMICAAAGCAGVVAWPAGAWRRGPSVPWGLRPAVSAGAVAVLLALVAWFGVELLTGGGLAGLAERIFGAALALWPLAVVASCRHRAGKASRHSMNPLGAGSADRAHGPVRGARSRRSAPSHQGSSPRARPNRLAEWSFAAHHRNTRLCRREVVSADLATSAPARQREPGTGSRPARRCRFPRT